MGVQYYYRVSRRRDWFLAYHYINRRIDGKPLGSSYIVILKDRHVVANGPGRLRENPSTTMGMFAIVPLK